MVIFDCVYHRDAFFIKRFIRSGKYDECINFMDIINKLTKNDIYAKEPSDEIVMSYVAKSIDKVLIRNTDIRVCYVFSNIDSQVAENFKEYVRNRTKTKILFNLYVMDPENCSGLEKIFSSINRI